MQKQARDPAYMFVSALATFPIARSPSKNTLHHHQGLHDRGTIEVGKRADLNLIDMQKLKIKHPEFIHDSTSGNDTPRWHQVRHFSTLQVFVVV